MLLERSNGQALELTEGGAETLECRLVARQEWSGHANDPILVG